MIAAILRAQLLSMRPGANRGLAISVFVGLLWYGFWAAVATWAAFFVAHATAERLQYLAPLGLLAVCLYWQLMPVLSASMGSSLDLRKLMVYPVPPGQLFVVDLMLRFLTGIEMLLALTGAAIGLARNPVAGGPAAILRVSLAVLGFIVFNVLLASGTRSLLERLLARRKVRELVALLLAMVWVLPRFFMTTGIRLPWLHSAGLFAGHFGWPWSAAAHAAVPLGISSTEYLVSWLSLGFWTLLAAWYGRTQFERNLRYDSLAAQAMPLTPVSERRLRWTDRVYRIPSLIWRDPLAAIVEKELRTLARTARFRMVFVMGFTFGLMLWLPMVLRQGVSQQGGFRSDFLVIVCIYAMTLIGNVTYWNCLGLDRSAAMFYFAAPQPLSRTLLGKNIAYLLFIYLEAVILAGIAAIFHLEVGFGKVVEAFFVIGVCATYLMGLGNISSVRYPRALSPERVSQGGSNRGTQALLLFLYPVMFLPVILAYVARYAFQSQIAFSLILSLAAAIGLTFYWIALESAVRTASERRQMILEDLSKGGGPIGG